MIADRTWALKNLGGDPTSAAAIQAAGQKTDPGDRALTRSLIDFDSEGAGLQELATAAPAAAVGLDKFVAIQWPAGLAPHPGSRPEGESLPPADVLVVTWTMDEGHALSRVLTPGQDSDTTWKPYTKNFTAIAQHMLPDCPAREAKRLGTYWTTRIGQRSVALFKSDSHMSQDGTQLPNALVWKQIIGDCKPRLVITTGTGGGIGSTFEVGDVIVSRFVQFDCKDEFKKLNGEQFASPKVAPAAHFAPAEALFHFNAAFLPKGNTRAPKVKTSAAFQTGIATTDFFGFDDSANTYGLQGKADLSEMGDAVLGMVCKELGSAAPPYTIVRNVSDPQIASGGLTLQQQKNLAATIYKAYGRWSTVCSAIVCWAIIAAL
jgi:nucleoside phosphorylase